jgi:hypothetical protein
MRRDVVPPTQVQALEALERRHDLFSFRVGGWSAWRVMRNPVHRMTMALPLAEPSRSTVGRSLKALAASFKLLWLLLFAGRRDLVVKTCRSGLRLPQGGQFRDVYFDGLLQRGPSCLKLEDINSPDFEEQAAKAWRRPDLDTVVFTFWGRVLGGLFPVDAAAFCESTSRLLADEVQLRVAPRWLLMRLSTVHWQIRLYAALLRRVRPKAVLVADTGEYALCIACAREGIRFIELQHGVFDAAHPDAIPAWVQGSRAEMVLPDFLACKGEFWMSQLAGTRQGRDHAVAVGIELIDLARERRSKRSVDGCVNLVLTTQGLDSRRLAAWMADVIAQAPARLDWKLWIKLHPVYDAKTTDYRSLAADSRVKIIGGAEQPNVFDLLADADLHLSIASACHFDAAALGVRSVVVPLAGHEPMLDVVDARQIFLADKPADVWAIVQGPSVDASSGHRFATPGFLDNLQGLLSR